MALFLIISNDLESVAEGREGGRGTGEPDDPLRGHQVLLRNTSLAAKGALANRLHAAPPAKSKMAARGPQNGRRGLEWCLPLGFWAF